MIYRSNEVREAELKNISRLYVKLAGTKPSEDLTLDDIRSIMYYLRKMEDEVNTEIREEMKRKQIIKELEGEI